VPSRYLIGIDLGTTNSVVAYIDTQEVVAVALPIHIFPIPQLVAHGEVLTLPSLPSFLYFPTNDELSAGAVSATWDEDPPMVTGVLAREQGALVPSRQVSSAKSWLSYAGVDRRAKILPAQAESPQPMISPVDASARYLMHLRDAWNGAIGNEAGARFEHQEIVLTVPASFYEDARELTVEAARSAGLGNVTLLEEPLAAFYAWIAANRSAPGLGGSSLMNLPEDRKDYDLLDGELILVCDIGGGTSDFSLIRARLVDGELQFERTAIGEHLLLGGDNLDFALARRVEEKLGDIRLTLRQRYALRRACCASKELLLSDSNLERVPVTLLGSGRSVIGQALTVDLTRQEVLQILTDGFLPITAPGELPSHNRQSGLREIGLPYASDPAITRHLAAFLTQAGVAMSDSSAPHPMARPDAVLFNGGFCVPAVTRDKIVAAISVWFGGARSGWRPRLLNNEAVDGAVARGAAYYSSVRRGTGLRIKSGSGRTYYIGLGSGEVLQGICILPAGIDEGTSLPLLNREFSVMANRPASFPLYSSRTRHDAHGEVVPLGGESVDSHGALVSLLRYGKLRDVLLVVRLRASFTEVGTLEIWCESRDTPHRWRLQFELRGEEAQGPQLDMARPQSISQRPSLAAISDASVEHATQLIRRVFGEAVDGDGVAPASLVNQLEEVLGAKKDSWPAAIIRRFVDVLIEVAAGRKKSARHEVRWLNLCGWCLRPGFGVRGDDARVNHILAIASNELAFADDLQGQVEKLVMLRRISGGINAGYQQALYRNYAARGSRKKKGRANRQLEYDEWRLLASLEQLMTSTRVSLGQELLARVRKEPGDAIWLWSLGRLGTRIPLYGPLHSVVAAPIASEWLKALLGLSPLTAAACSAIVMIARRIDDPLREMDDVIREQAISRLMESGCADETYQALSGSIPLNQADAERSFGESLPAGLQVVLSSNCLLSVPALHNSDPALGREP
jgi:molecular chaperone DnaK (HSP70)